MDKPLELSRVRKILAKDRCAMEKPLKLPTEDILSTPEEALGILLGTPFPGARIKKRPEMVDQSGKTRANNFHMSRFFMMAHHELEFDTPWMCLQATMAC